MCQFQGNNRGGFRSFTTSIVIASQVFHLSPLIAALIGIGVAFILGMSLTQREIERGGEPGGIGVMGCQFFSIFLLLGYYGVLGGIFGPLTLTLSRTATLVLPMHGWSGVIYVLLLLSLVSGALALVVSLCWSIVEFFNMLRRVLFRRPREAILLPPFVVLLLTILWGFIGSAGLLKVIPRATGGVGGVITAMILWIPLIGGVILLGGAVMAIKETLSHLGILSLIGKWLAPGRVPPQEPGSQVPDNWSQKYGPEFNTLRQTNPPPDYRTSTREQLRAWVQSAREGVQGVQQGATWGSIIAAILCEVLPEGEATRRALEISDDLKEVSESESLKNVERILDLALIASNPDRNWAGRLLDVFQKIIEWQLPELFQTPMQRLKDGLNQVAEEVREKHREKLVAE